MATHDSSMTPEQIKKANIAKIWKVAGILALITAVEFLLAFIWPEGAGRGILNALFLILTVAKAFFIVAEFMHLKHEVKFLIYSVILPMIFVVWLIIALLYEGGELLRP